MCEEKSIMYKVYKNKPFSPKNLLDFAEDMQSAKDIAFKHLKTLPEFSETSICRSWTKEDITTIDYGNHNNYIYIVKFL